MLILNPGRMAESLRTATIPEATKARITLVGYVVTLLVGRGTLLGYRTWGDLLLNVLYLGVAIGGFWSCFRVNQRGDGRAFIERYVCLGVPVSLWLYGAYAVGYYLAFLILHDRTGIGPSEFEVTARPYFGLLSLGLLVLFFAVVRRLLGRVSERALSNER